MVFLISDGTHQGKQAPGKADLPVRPLSGRVLWVILSPGAIGCSNVIMTAMMITYNDNRCILMDILHKGDTTNGIQQC